VIEKTRVSFSWFLARVLGEVSSRTSIKRVDVYINQYIECFDNINENNR
jgi:hypothetical protein